MLSNRPVSKRILGILLLSLGAIAVLGMLAVDWVGAGADAGFGPAQRVGLGVGLGVAAFGLSLIPLGDRPA